MSAALLQGWATLASQVPWLVALWLMVLGSIFGSFLNCAVDRLPRGRSLRTPPSECDSCHTRLGWPDLVPVFSWLALRGRCRHCGADVPVRNTLLEVATTLTPLLAYLWLGLSGGLFLATLSGWALLALLVFLPTLAGRR